MYLVLINTFATALYLVLTSYMMKRWKFSSGISIAATHLAAAALLSLLALPDAPAIGGALPASPVLVMMGLVVALKLLSKQMHTYAYAHAEVANVTVFSAFIPIFGVTLGALFLDEIPSFSQIIGTAIICGAVYLQFLAFDRKRGLAGNLLSPFREIFHSKPVLMAFLSTLPPAVSALFTKEGALSWNPLYFSIVTNFLIGASAALIEIAFYRTRSHSLVRAMRDARFWLVGMVFAVAQYSFVLALTVHDVGHFMALQRLSMVFQIVLAYFLLRERTQFSRKLFFGAIIILGAMVMEYGA